MVLLKKHPPKNKRLLILATTTRKSILREMDMLDAFDAEIYVPVINSLEQVEEVLMVHFMANIRAFPYLMTLIEQKR